MSRLNGKVAVITGGASGMGLASALLFAEHGARVIIADRNEAAGGEALALASTREVGDRMRFIQTDVSQEADVAAMIDFAVEAHGRVDIVFNNAGILGAFEPIWESSSEDWDRMFGVLAKGVFFGVKHAARAMRKQGQGGSIINTASIGGLSGGGGPPLYSAAKAAVINLTQSASRQLAPERIRVNAICPGGILTPLVHGGHPQALAAALDSFQPWPDHGKAEHIATAALFLASEDSIFVTGEALVVDGGLTAAGPDLERRVNPSPPSTTK